MRTFTISLIGSLGFVTLAQAQNVGIGTTSPQARLHVTDSSVLFSALGAASNTPGNPPAQGAGRRMMWYADKAAFRAGYASGTEWDKDAVGRYSFGTGVAARASGLASAAMGLNVVAGGDNAFATGSASQANGSYSVAMGWGANATGLAAVALGYSDFATGDNAFAAGSENTANATSTVAIGLQNQATNPYATAMGYSNQANGNLSVAIGAGNKTSDFYAMAFGSSNMAGNQNAMALGRANEANGNTAFAAGVGNVANGTESMALGSGSRSTGIQSFAAGKSLTAFAYRSIALGSYNDSIASANPNTWVSTDPLLTIGNGDEFGRRNALTILKNGYVGIGTNNPAARLHVRFPGGAGAGQLMVEEQGDGGDGARITFRNDARTDKFWDLYGATSNTTADARFNFFYNGYGDVMNLTGNGRVGIGVPTAAATLHVRSASNFSVPQQHLQVTADSYSRLRMSNTVNPLPYWDMAGLTHASTPANAQLNFFYSQNGSNGIDILSLKGNGNATLAGTLTQNSDARLKKDIEQLDNVLPLLQTLNGYQYKWKDAWREQEIQTGLLAQEVEKVMPELVKEDEKGTKSVNYLGVVPYLVEAVKTLRQQNEALIKRMEALEKR